MTLTGPAGVGKTRLAIELARQAAASDGVWLIQLDAAGATTDLIQVVAETMHLPGERKLLERFASADCLLVLDNCEHVVGPAADLASLLLDAAPRLTVLATSQLPLGLDGERVYPLEPLPIAESVQLFTYRAAEIRRQFVLDDDTAVVVEQLCLALDGLPLAIELAAAQGEIALGAGDSPPAGRPLRPAAGPGEPEPRAPARTGRGHCLELRAAVP